MPTRMIFKTTPAGQQTPVEAIRIGSNQVVTLANALPIASGGTGQTTAGAAINALLPSQSGNSGRFLTTNGTSPSWDNVPAPNNGTLTLAVSGTGLSGSASFTADQAGNSTFTVTSNATSANTASAIVARDGSGNFTAGTITAALSGNASTATALETARTIGGVSFNGSANINLPGVNVAGNQNTTGTAANVTGTVAIANGGTGATTAGGALTGLGAAPTASPVFTGASTFANGTVAFPSIRFTSEVNTGFYRSDTNQISVSTNGALAATFAANGDFTAAGNVTAFSDERLKQDWSELPTDFVERLSQVKHGTYTRTDSGERHIGVGAQSLRLVAPEGVIDGEHLSVAYGNVALAACVKLAQRLLDLEQKLAVTNQHVAEVGGK
jgi:hypothetical protein